LQFVWFKRSPIWVVKRGRKERKNRKFENLLDTTEKKRNTAN